ncbi:hypothetical protein MMC10_004596 [Thelotrema lepadinum]|nr:hypothetical protein [Thelotrema lepadinum]
MAEYSKLTVVKLKEVLKERGLPVSGNKAALVTRLEENNAEKEEQAPPEGDLEQPEAEGATIEQEKIPSTEPPVLAEKDATPEVELQNDAPVEEPAKVASEIVQADAMDTQTDAIAAPETSMVEAVSEEKVRAEAEAAPLPTEEPVEVHGALQEQEEMDTRPLDSALAEATHGSTLPPATVLETPSESQQVGEPIAESGTSVSQATPSQISVQHITLPTSDQSSLNPEDVVEDTKKRKRRSQSPIPDSAEVATKKAKALDGSPRATLTEDSETQEVPDNGGAVEHTEITAETQDSMVTQDNAALSQAPKSVEEKLPPDQEAMDAQEDNQDNTTHNEGVAKTPPPAELKDAILSPAKTPTNAKFKGLFAATAPSHPVRTDSEQYPVEDREVEPAIHPATTALYIRNFMRPLQHGSLRDHLQALASPSNEATDGDVIKEFFLDSIKTHCLVQFHSISAASRVRLALHDRVWPDERTRKALWVDFVPEEKIPKWIEVEQDGGGGRGAPQKRFEVVYEKENDEIVAYLQEADSMGPRGSLSSIGGPTRNGHTATAPPPPRPIAPSAPRADAGKGFRQLDDLFKSTDAKPKLYFQPVAESMAEKRLDLLAAGRGGGRGDDMRRFSFEDTTIVDKGPEFGSGWRGGLRGGRGGYGGRGYRGGYRGGDSWRDTYR